MDDGVMVGPHAMKNEARYTGRSRELEAGWPRARSQAKPSKLIGTTLLVTAAACTQTVAAMSAQQDVRRQREEGVIAADALDGVVAIGPGCRNCRALP